MITDDEIDSLWAALTTEPQEYCLCCGVRLISPLELDYGRCELCQKDGCAPDAPHCPMMARDA